MRKASQAPGETSNIVDISQLRLCTVTSACMHVTPSSLFEVPSGFEKGLKLGERTLREVIFYHLNLS